MISASENDIKLKLTKCIFVLTWLRLLALLGAMAWGSLGTPVLVYFITTVFKYIKFLEMHYKFVYDN